jgi:membrane associated rhomboid family serine protease
MHLAGNLLPALALCLLLEARFGTARVGLLWVAATAGGAFVSAVLGPPCALVRTFLIQPAPFPPCQN